MAKFKVHKYIQAFLAPMGMHSYKPEEPTIELPKRVFAYYALISLIFSIISSIMFFYTHLDDVKEALQAFKICAGTFQSGICIFALGFQLKKIKTLHLRLQEIVNEGTSHFDINNILNIIKFQCFKR